MAQIYANSIQQPGAKEDTRLWSETKRHCITKAGGKHPETKQIKKKRGCELTSQNYDCTAILADFCWKYAGQPDFFIESHPIWATYCFSSAMLLNITKGNDILIIMWQQNGPRCGCWQSCHWYSMRPLSSGWIPELVKQKLHRKKTLPQPLSQGPSSVWEPRIARGLLLLNEGDAVEKHHLSVGLLMATSHF